MAEDQREFDCDPGKREKLLRERRIDLEDMAAVFDDPYRLEFVDARFDYGEERRLTVGRISGRFFTVVYTLRGTVTWLVTAWPANRKERERYVRRGISTLRPLE